MVRLSKAIPLAPVLQGRVESSYSIIDLAYSVSSLLIWEEIPAHSLFTSARTNLDLDLP